MNNILKKALVSEKSFSNVGKDKFTFIVDPKADKETIADVCEKLFGVNVLEVNTANIKGKVKMSKRGKGKRSDFKKAVVTLKKGQKIDLFDIETEKSDKDKKTKEQKADKTKTIKEDKDTTVKVREKKK